MQFNIPIMQLNFLIAQNKVPLMILIYCQLEFSRVNQGSKYKIYSPIV